MSGYYLMYLRKSRADLEKEKHGEFETLAVHERTLTELAQRMGYPVAEVYRELVSGETIAARPEFQKVLERMQDPMCLGVIVHAIDRLGRGDPMEYGWVLSTFRHTRTAIVTPNRVYDPSNPEDMQSLKLQMFVANIEYDHIRQRMHAGTVAAAKRGCFVGATRPFGYQRAKVGRDWTLVPDETEAPIVREMFRMASEGMNKGQIARALNAQGLRTMHGGYWNSSRVAQQLTNPVYKGMVRFGWRVRNPGPDGRRHESRRDDCVLVEGLHEPLVDPETWDAANRLAFEGVPVHHDCTIKNPLAGIIVCAKCGRALVRTMAKDGKGAKYPRLRHAYTPDCHCVSIPLDYVLDALVDVLQDAVNDVQMALDAPSDSGVLDALVASREREGKRLDKLVELFCAGGLTVDEFMERRKESDARMGELSRSIAELQSAPTPEEVRVGTLEALGKLRDPEVPAEAKNAALKAVLKRVAYTELDTAHVNRRIRLDVEFR